jgi:hypothetical protein
MTRRVYFIKPVGMDGPVKIGCSSSPIRRRDALATWSPFALEIIAQIEGGFKLEQRFHAKFRDQHERHEWFSWSPELAETIASVQAGSFDIDTLPEPRPLPSSAGNRKGRKWTDAEKDRVKRRNKHRRILRDTGLVLEWPHSDERENQFFADPHRFGITPEERNKQWKIRSAKLALERAEELLAVHGLTVVTATARAA